jgi:hypothetical protein
VNGQLSANQCAFEYVHLSASGKTLSAQVRAQDTHLRRYLVDPASSHMLVSKIKPCMSKYKPY